MEQRKSTPEGQSGAPPAVTMPPAWIQRTAPYSPDRRAKMLEHMARTRSVPQPQAAKDILGDAYGYAVLSAIVAFLLQLRVPFYFGAFIFLTDGERIESALATIGIRFEPGAIGPEIVKGFVSLFGWFALLVSLRDLVPEWLAAWMPPAEPSWSLIAGIALAVVIVEALATRAMRRALPWLGLEIRWDSLTWKVMKLALAIGALVLVGLHGPV
ncbi:hypothetical protein JJC00_21480 [Bradyrhizobium diazoefficiens]|uniref:hypothetical protein n=1 Tax=Bradyrhizobium diazoefficiens TaxID=1355477 RepID=UPI00190AB7A2|nr:hypothetical protein [Bradyrhizobium diazoefficiens]QQO31219.1 hypothetical protein JJC00_21480 [Bradyrhizobium diazoefficiens]